MIEEINDEIAEIHIPSLALVGALPAEIDAGAELSLKVRAACAAGCDLQGSLTRLIDAQGAAVTETVLLAEPGADAAIGEFTVKVPATVGEYTWSVLFPAQEAGNGAGRQGIMHQESSVSFSFTVKPHRITLSVWDVPLPVSRGEKFTVHIGAKCSAGCSLAGLPFSIEDGNHRKIAAGKLGETVLPQTTGTYWAELKLDAPMDEGVYTWLAAAAVPETELPHQADPASFSFRAAAAPEYTVTIQVTRKHEGTAIKDAYIMLGLYQAATDRQGIARVQVPGGPQELYVTQTDYIAFQTTLDVSGDTELLAELEYFPQL